MPKKMKQQQFYCVSCNSRVSLPADDIWFKMGKSSKRKKLPMLKGKCKKCDGKLTKFVKIKDSQKLKSKFGTK